MIETMGDILIGGGLLGLFFCGWVLICNEKTFRLQGQLINLASQEARRRIDNGEPNWREPYDALQRVTYNDMLWSFVFLKDPMKLYENNKRNRSAAA